MSDVIATAPYWVNLLGFTGSSIIAAQSVPLALAPLQDHFSFVIPESVQFSQMGANVVGGSLLLAYAVIKELQPLWTTVPFLILANLMGCGCALFVHCRSRRRLY